ncbi:pyridoxine 5'-phosphate synthase [Bartonella sp. DGB1]|uniref:pyridoxine 5'-phosphate synthase n=1 Tax=Bartonella sp. DGB1 TaxID=3239807 RepID=UPI0035263FD9
MSVSLSANLNAVALLRNRRGLAWPDLLDIAKQSCVAGAKGITVHPRPDERHIKYQDVKDLREFLNKFFPQHELNVEGFPDSKFLELIELVKPHQVTLVPDHPEQNTSDHGWDFKQQFNILQPAINRLKQTSVRISLFCEYDSKNLIIAKELGAHALEIYTGPYAANFNDLTYRKKYLKIITETATEIKKLGLHVHAGHDLTIENIPQLISAFPDFTEMSIGHALIADALTFGIKNSIKRFLNVMNNIN